MLIQNLNLVSKRQKRPFFTTIQIQKQTERPLGIGYMGGLILKCFLASSESIGGCFF